MDASMLCDFKVYMLVLTERSGALREVRAVRLGGEAAAAFGPSPVLERARTQLEEYFRGERRAFELYYELEGTAFQLAVWRELASIPYGETRTYGQIAARIGRPNAARAVGRAVGANPLWIVLPCHRVIRSSGALGGYAGGLPMKRRLMELEGIRV